MTETASVDRIEVIPLFVVALRLMDTSMAISASEVHQPSTGPTVLPPLLWVTIVKISSTVPGKSL